VISDGFHGDTSRMYFVGAAPVLARRLSEVCREAMWLGIRAVRPGARLGDIGYAIQTYAESNNFSVVREYCGHGIAGSTTRILRCSITAGRAPGWNSSRG